MRFFLLGILITLKLFCYAQCDNKMLNLDSSHPDFVALPVTFTAAEDFTVELWFQSLAVNTTADERCLLELYDPASSIRVYESAGDLYLDVTDNACTDVQQIVSSVRFQWMHLSVSRSAGMVTATISCNQASVASSCSHNSSIASILLGTDQSLVSSNSWQGNVDEIRLWSTVRSATEICDNRFCTIDSGDTDLVALYTADQGVAGDPAFPANDNTAIITLADVSGNSNDGLLHNFALVGQSSNFICSTSGMLYPLEANIHLTDYATQTNPVTMMCSGDLLHVCLKDDAGVPLILDPSVAIAWEYNNGNGWSPLNSPSFNNGICFGVPTGELTIDCTYNIQGYEDWLLRAIITISDTNSSNTCEYFTAEVPIRICCPLEPVSINVTSNFSSNLFCDGDLVAFSVNLQSPYPFYNPPAADITVDWFYDDNGTIMPLNNAQNNNNFTIVDVPVSQGTFCFRADITGCSATKSITIEKCFDIDIEPTCGTICATPDVGILNTLSTVPKVYEICPLGTAKIEMLSGFANCGNNIWESSFDPAFSTTTFLGATNTTINTNILPTNWPAGATSIYYRTQCQPSMIPSGCPSCYSNVVEIRLIDQLAPPIINGPSNICPGGTGVWTVDNPLPGVTYSWICDGITVASGNTYMPVDGECCILRADDGCSVEDSVGKCFEECEIIGAISCPKAPNQCPKVGDQIHLCICDVTSNCSNSFSYNWGWSSGTLGSQSGCDLFHFPAVSGTTYYVTVTENSSGCTSVFARDVSPCP